MRPSLIEGIALLLVLGAFLATASPYVLGGDNGEFATLSSQFGVAHPPGYPAYILVLRALSFIPGSSVAHSAALATSLLGVLNLALLMRACRVWGASKTASVLASTLFSLSSLAWILSTHAEVFILNACMASVILWLSAPTHTMRPILRAAALGAAAGVALSNHHSAIFLAPLGLYGVYTCAREDKIWFPAFLTALGTCLACIGLFYGALLVIAQSVAGTDAWAWGNTHTFDGLFHHFIRADYGTTQLAISKADVSPLDQVVGLFQHIATDLLILPPLLAILGFAAHLVRPASLPKQDSIPRLAVCAVLAAFLCAGPFFASLFNLERIGVAILVLKRFYLLPSLLLVLPTAWGLDVVIARLTPQDDTAKTTPSEDTPQFSFRPILALCFVAALSSVFALPKVAEHHRPSVQHYLINTLESLPQNSVLLGQGDQRLFGFVYVQNALQIRPDVLYIDPRLLHYDWYRARVSKTLPKPLPDSTNGSIQTLPIAQTILQTKRPLFLATPFSKPIVSNLPTYPYGTAIRVLPKDTAPPDPYALEKLNLDLFERFSVEQPPPPAQPATWSSVVYRHYGSPWESLAQVFAAMGDQAAANRCQARAKVFSMSPQSAPTKQP